jgi:heterodisulfide reductase subunit C/quinone-modifying oxidoreductase subunit QmoC
MYTLKRMAIQEGCYRENEGHEASGFAGYFMDNVEEFGRSFELGVASRFTLRYHPLKALKMAPLGLGMLRKGRLNLTPKRIKNIKQLKAILNKARELGESS